MRCKPLGSLFKPPPPTSRALNELCSLAMTSARAPGHQPGGKPWYVVVGRMEGSAPTHSPFWGPCSVRWAMLFTRRKWFYS